MSTKHAGNLRRGALLLMMLTIATATRLPATTPDESSNDPQNGPGFLDDLATWVPDDLTVDGTSVDFGSTAVPAIPADFFYVGSGAFIGRVTFRGEDLFAT